jgi:predicted nuclease of restriction endonuclease-like RecB superfamily
MTDPATIRDAYDTLATEARRHTAGGVLSDADRRVIVRRVAETLGITVEAVTAAMTQDA